MAASWVLLFCFHGNCGKVCPTDSDLFGLSRSTSCGCCSYQVSSISDWRVTCYDIFVIFNFLAFWPFPWQWQPFWKNQPYTAQLHLAYDIPTRFHKVWSRHLREIERTKMCGIIIIIIIIIIIVKKKRRIAIHHPTTVKKKTNHMSWETNRKQNMFCKIILSLGNIRRYQRCNLKL